jgi:hypothetical protein
MFSLLLVTSALLGLDPAPAPTAPDDRDSYEAALAQAGRDADAHVRLALWCEAHGLQPERLRHLTLAILNNPAHPLARGLLGLVAYQGRWKRPEAIAAAVQADPARAAVVAQYEEKRDKLAETSEAHWKLALWCEENGLKAESVAHLWSSVRLDPSREAAWKRLGHKNHNGRWVTDAQLTREKEESELQKHADKQWRPILEKWRGMLSDKDAVKRAEALSGLSGVTDPRAVPMIWALFAMGDAVRQKLAVQVFGQIDAQAASRALAALALSSGSDDVRRVATETLRRRDVREYAGGLIDLLRDPVKYEVRQVNGPGLPGSIFMEGKNANLQRRYNAPPIPEIRINPRRDYLTYDDDGLPVIMARGNRFLGAIAPPVSSTAFGWGAGQFGPQQAGSALLQQIVQDPSHAGSLIADHQSRTKTRTVGMSWASLGVNNLGFTTPAGGQPIMVGQAILNTMKAAETAQQQLANDVAALDRYNAEVTESNGQIARVLTGATGRDVPPDRESWQRWLVDQFGYAQRFSDQQPKPTFVQEVTVDLPSVSGFATGQNGYSQIVSHHSCFGAGTLVHTMSGTRPIETLRVGDVILTQNIKTGALGYQPITVIHHNPPIETLRVQFGGEAIISSAFHRFWKAGKGWVMARDVSVGDTLRTLGGSYVVDAVDDDRKQPVFNLDVAENANFFVGTTGALVHDHTLPDLRLAPFDATPPLIAASHP